MVSYLEDAAAYDPNAPPPQPPPQPTPEQPPEGEAAPVPQEPVTYLQDAASYVPPVEPTPITPDYRSPVELATPFGMAPPPATPAYQGQAAAPATPQQGWAPPPSASAVPSNPTSFLGDFVQQVQQAPTLKDKATAVLDLGNKPWESARNRIGQRGYDYLTTGNPDTTLGGRDLGSLLQHPENIGYELGTDVLMPGGLGGQTLHVGTDGIGLSPGAEPDYFTWLDANKATELKRVQDTGDIGILYDDFTAYRKGTLETGGIGAVPGMFAEAALIDPTSVPSILVGAGAEKAAQAALGAGKTGVARGITTTNTLAQGAIDPLGTAAGGVLGKAVPAIFGPTEQATRGAARESLNEALHATGQAYTDTTTLGIDRTGVTGLPDLAPLPALDTRSVEPAFPAPVFTRDTTGNPYVTHADGTPIAREHFDQLWTDMAHVAPPDFWAAKGESGDWVRWRQAMRLNGYLQDDLPAARRTALANELPETVAAGDRWVNLLTARIHAWGNEEVQRMADAFQRYAQAPESHVQATNRALALKEALDRAEYSRPVLLRTAGDVIRYQPKQAMTGVPPVEGLKRPPAPTPAPRASDEALLDAQGLRRTGSDLRRREVLRQMLYDPEAFSPTHPEYSAMRRELYSKSVTGAPLREGGEPFWVKPGTAAADRYPAALARYQDFHDAWKANVGQGVTVLKAPSSPLLFEQEFGNRQMRMLTAQVADDPATWNALRDALDTAGLHDIQLELGAEARPHLAELTAHNVFNSAMGAYYPGEKMIRLGLDYYAKHALSGMPLESFLNVLDHETMHAVRDLGLLTPQEWEILVREAATMPDPRMPHRRMSQDIQNRYMGFLNPADMTPARMDKLDEELVAEMYAYWRSGHRLAPEAESLLHRIYTVLKSFIQKLQGTKAETIMQQIASGEIGARPRTYVKTPGIREPKAAIAAAHAADELDTLPAPEGSKALLRGADAHHLIAYQLPGVRGKQPTPIYSVLTHVMDELDEGRTLAQRNAVTPLTGADARRFAALQSTYGDVLREAWDAPPAQWDAEHVRAAAEFTADAWMAGLPPIERKVGGLAGQLLDGLQEIAAFRRAMGLFNWAAAPRQLLTQFTGNLFGIGLAHPRALAQYFNIKDASRIFRGFKAPNTLTRFQGELEDFGLSPHNAMVLSQNKTLATAMTNTTGLFERVGSVLAPKLLRNVVATPDELMRNSIARDVWKKGIVGIMDELPGTAAKTGERWISRYGTDFAIAPRELAQITRDVQARFATSDGYAKFRPVQLESELRTRLAGRVRSDLATNYANRVARDYANGINTLYQRAAQEVKRVGFSWDYSNLDRAVSNVFLYHFWATRASALYAKEFIKKPAAFGAFLRLGQQLMAEAEQNDYPDWLKGWTRMLNTPAGMSLWFSPMDLWSTAATFADWQYGGDPNAFAHDLTALGQLRGWAPFSMNPVAEFVLWAGGAFGGEDAQMPSNVLGINRLTTLAADVLNLLGYHDMLPAGMGKDADGTFRPFAPRPIDELVARAALALGHPVLDPYASQIANTQTYLRDILLEQHPEWATAPDGANQLMQAMVDAEESAKAGTPSEVWLQAEERMTEQAVAGPDFPGLPEPLRGIVGGVIRNVAPVRITAQPASKRTLPNAGGDTYDVKNAKNAIYDTPVATQLTLDYDRWYTGGGDQKRADAISGYWKIVHTSLPSVQIGDRTYSQGDLRGLSEGARYDLAMEWLHTQGYTRHDLDAFQQTRLELEQQNPNLAGYVQYRQYVDDYPNGGRDGFITDAMQANPSFARYMQQTGYAPGTDDWRKAATYVDGYLALTGQHASVYDPIQLPGQGTIAGSAVPGLPPGMSLQAQRASEQAANAAAPNAHDDFVQSVQDDVDRIYAAQEWLDANAPGVMAGDYLDRGTYDAMKAAGVLAPKREDASLAYQYYDWLAENATAPGHDVADFLDTLDFGGGGADLQHVTPEMAAQQRNIALVESRPDQPDFTTLPAAAANYDLPLYTGPSANNPVITNVPAGFKLRVIAVQGDFTEVWMPGSNNTIGWVPSSYLLAA